VVALERIRRYGPPGAPAQFTKVGKSKDPENAKRGISREESEPGQKALPRVRTNMTDYLDPDQKGVNPDLLANASKRAYSILSKGRRGHTEVEQRGVLPLLL